MRSCIEKISCPICGRLITKINISKHLGAHNRGNTKFEHCRHTKCNFCGKEFTTTSGCGIHELYCKKNPDHKIRPATNGSFGKKGLSKETDSRVAKSAEAASKSLRGKSGHPQSAETRQKISEARKKYIEEHPDQVPFKLNHSSKESYPEKYFRKWLIKNKLLDKQELQVSRYTLDFAGEAKKVYLEVDGSQHHLDGMVEHDAERTNFLSNLGWKCLARVYWPDYQKLNKYQKHLYLADLKQRILDV